MPDQDEESGKCPTCGGIATRVVRKPDAEGNVSESVEYCEDCDGTGFDQSDGDVD